MQQMTKRWLSLLLAAVLCVTAGGVPALAAELAEENTAAADSQTGGDTGDTGDNGTGADPENQKTPENPENPSDNGGQPADDDSGKTPDGSFGDAGIKPAALASAPVSTALPEDFTYEFEVDAPLAFKVDVNITGQDGKTVVARGTTSKGTNGKTGFTLTSRCRKRANSMQKTTRLTGR